MKKNHALLFFLIILQSCQSGLLIDNKQIIDKIDKLNFSKTIFQVSVDENENIIDTLSIEKIKMGKNDIVLYKLKEYRNKYGTSKQSYFRSNEDLFYQATDFGFSDWRTEYQTFVNKDKVIDKAQMINIESEKSDTIFMKYNYSYDSEGKKETLSITSLSDSIGSLSFVKYNDNEKTEFKYRIIDNDTIEKSRMKYLNRKITESTHEYKEPFMLDVYDYSINEDVKSKKTFKKIKDSLINSVEYIYEYNSSGNLEKIIINDIENDTIMIWKYITTYNNVYKKLLH
ncbi:hypothetical protein [Lacinutrix algicola]|uniref:hypothetical protein n=1 Tax=Lacinutrix algicola TaxID=342954 RepID=UPI0006E22E71|nr:hypothetical protein [Lacinutrix algicola]